MRTATPREYVPSVVADGHSFLEAPRWRDGRLHASDFFTGRVLAFDAHGAADTVLTLDDQPSGLGWTPEGDLLVVAMKERRLLRHRDGEVTQVADLREVTGGLTNDMVVDELGGAYVGNFGWDESRDPVVRSTTITRVAPDGTLAIAAEDIVFPNGMAISPDGATFYVAETFAARISAFDRAPDGTLSNRRVWASFAAERPATTTAAATGVLPDGIALDADGALWVGDAAGGPALRVAEGGHILATASAGEQAPYAVALGGDDRRTLYICAATPYGQGDHAANHRARLLACRVDCPGTGLP